MQDPLLDCEGDIRDYLAEHTTTQCPPLLAEAMEYAVFPGGARVRQLFWAGDRAVFASESEVRPRSRKTIPESRLAVLLLLPDYDG